MLACRAASRAPRHAAIYQRCSHSTRPLLSIQDSLRQLMVHCAQPVAIITTRLSRPSLSQEAHKSFHGATISSFSSVAMHPYPMISFALQLPSRLASALRPSSMQNPLFVVNVLSASQIGLARRFSQRDPFTTLPSIPEVELGMGIGMTKEGQPMLLNSLGNLSCEMVKSIPLDFTTNPAEEVESNDPSVVKHAQISELFIARVVRVEQAHYGPEGEVYPLGEHRHHDEPETKRPMVYYQKEFTTVKG